MLFESPVQCGRDFFGRMTSNVLSQGSAKDFAAGALRATSQALDLLEHIVGNGDGRFHTLSITQGPTPAALCGDRLQPVPFTPRQQVEL